MNNEKHLKEYVRERAKKTRRLVKAFNEKHSLSLVRLVLSEELGFATFVIRLRLNDPFIDCKQYEEGSAYIYVTDALYAEIQKLAGDVPLSWNNTGSIGWLSLEEVEAK